MDQGSEHKDVSDPTYNAADFWAQLSGGRLRWFATILTLAGGGLSVYEWTQGDQARMDYPIQLQGPAATWTIAVASAIIAAIAIINWRGWFKKKRKIDAGHDANHP